MLKNTKMCLLVCVCIVLSPCLAAAQNGAFVLDHVDPLTIDGGLPTDTLVSFNIRIVNDVGTLIDGITNGFHVYSPTGCQWTQTTGDTLGSFGWADAFDLVFNISYFSANGQAADTVSFSGIRAFSGGLPADFDDTAYTITIGPIGQEFDGDTICVDSCWYPPAGTWKWAAAGDVEHFPDWDGPHCFVVDICGGPDTDMDGSVDRCDNCPTVANSNQADADGDGLGDLCDNCPGTYNITQGDIDSDGIGDSCDNCEYTYNPTQIDSDGDNVGDSCDNCLSLYNPDQQDSDFDGVGDTCDNCSLVENSMQEDTDSDGIGDSCDNCLALYNPLQEDSDSDGRGDSCDVGTVEFEADTRCGSVPMLVNFTDLSNPSGGNISWDWDFGDNNSSSEQSPQHTYQSTGVFDVTLTISDGTDSETLTKLEYITTQDVVSADFEGFYNPGSGVPMTVVFEPTVVGVATEYYWDFGDGHASSTDNPIHQYMSLGVYDVMLRVRLDLNDCHQVDSVIKSGYIVVNDLEPRFSATPTAGMAPLTVQFTDTSSGSPYAWFWDFGDGTTSYEQDPTHQYDTAGEYDVSLRIENSIGVDSLLKLDYIHATLDTTFADLFAEIYTTGARPGFLLGYYGLWTNVGTSPAQDCTLKVLLPPELEFYDIYDWYIQTGTYSGFSFLGDTLVFPLATIDPSQWYGGYVLPYGRVPEDVPMGYELVCEAWMTSSTTEPAYGNNYMYFVDTVVASMDPNDKLASPGGRSLWYEIDPKQRLTYEIQFENKKEATAEAIYIRVVDTLDPNLDWSTLAIGAMSHPDDCDWEFDPYTGVLSWFCDSIMLPPNVNPPEGEGGFFYSISPREGLPNGTEIPNEAFIRFDYNEWLHAPEDGDAVVRVITYPGCCMWPDRGNIDNSSDDILDISDLVYLVDYMFNQGQAPICAQEANINGSCCREGSGETLSDIDISDLVVLVDYMFNQGPPPLACP